MHVTCEGHNVQKTLGHMLMSHEIKQNSYVQLLSNASWVKPCALAGFTGTLANGDLRIQLLIVVYKAMSPRPYRMFLKLVL